MSTAILGSPRRWSWVVATSAALVSLVAPAAFARTSVTVWYEWEKPFIREMAKRFKIQTVPTMWLLDREGKLIDANPRGRLEQAVAAAVAAKT